MQPCINCKNAKNQRVNSQVAYLPFGISIFFVVLPLWYSGIHHHMKNTDVRFLEKISVGWKNHGLETKQLIILLIVPDLLSEKNNLHLDNIKQDNNVST